jgi:hypothetical protein
LQQQRLLSQLLLFCSQVSLCRTDALSSLVELDKHMAITHADEAAGLMFGVNPKQLLKKPFARCVCNRNVPMALGS